MAEMPEDLRPHHSPVPTPRTPRDPSSPPPPPLPAQPTIPEAVPQRGHLAVHGLGGLGDILQLPLQPAAAGLSPGCLLLRLLQLPLQLLHPQVRFLQLGEQRGRRLVPWAAVLRSAAAPQPNLPVSSLCLSPAFRADLVLPPKIQRPASTPASILPCKLGCARLRRERLRPQLSCLAPPVLVGKVPAPHLGPQACLSSSSDQTNFTKTLPRPCRLSPGGFPRTSFHFLTVLVCFPL